MLVVGLLFSLLSCYVVPMLCNTGFQLVLFRCQCGLPFSTSASLRSTCSESWAMGRRSTSSRSLKSSQLSGSSSWELSLMLVDLQVARSMARHTGGIQVSLMSTFLTIGSFSDGFKGICSVFVTAAFAFAGTELAGLAAAETVLPEICLTKGESPRISPPSLQTSFLAHYVILHRFTHHHRLPCPIYPSPSRRQR
jgi:Amino acid permease